MLSRVLAFHRRLIYILYGKDVLTCAIKIRRKAEKKSLPSLYLVTLVVAIFDQDNSGRLFQICLVGTIAIPLLVWVYIWMYGKLSGKHTMADLDLGREDRDDSQSPEA